MNNFLKGLNKEKLKYFEKRITQSSFSIEDFNSGMGQGYNMGVVQKQVRLKNKNFLSLWIDRNDEGDLVICLSLEKLIAPLHYSETSPNYEHLEFIGEQIIDEDGYNVFQKNKRESDSRFKQAILSIIDMKKEGVES